MGASLSRHIGDIARPMRPIIMFLMVDEVWAFAERRAFSDRLTFSYYLGLGLPLWINWVLATVLGAIIGRGFGDPAAYGFDFAFSALFIAILSGFWKGPRTGAVLAVAGAVSALTKLGVPGAWYIAFGGMAGVAVAVLLARPEDEADGA
jgi:predicted branched-subunit amino acid permease